MTLTIERKSCSSVVTLITAIGGAIPVVHQGGLEAHV